MSLIELAANMQRISTEQVVVRARQYLKKARMQQMNLPYSSNKPVISYEVATEIQAIACCTRLHGGDNAGFIWISYNDPAPIGRHPDYPKPPKLRSAIWTGEEMVQRAWQTICDTWIDVPTWLSQKPTIFSRQFNLDDVYSVMPDSDLVFLRLLDQFVFLTGQHKRYHENRMNSIAKDTPVDQRRRAYSSTLDNYYSRKSLLEVTLYRLTHLVDQAFADLAKQLQIAEVKPVTIEKQ